MEKPGSSLVASIVVHAAVVLGVMFYGLLGLTREPMNVETAVPVSIISDTIIEAAAADNPDDERVTEDASTAPVAPTPPEPVPPEPVPPPTPAPTPVKKATPPRPTPPRPPQPPRPTPPREPTLDLDSLAGPPRPGPRPGPRPPTGQTGAGSASQALGRASLQALAGQVTPYWDVNCATPGADDLVISVRVTLNTRGGIVGAPRLTQSRNEPGWRAAADSVLRAIHAAAPFDMPAGYEQQELPFSFRTATMCRNR